MLTCYIGNPQYRFDTTNAAQYNQTEDYATGYEHNETPQAEYGYSKTPLRSDEIRNETKETPFGSAQTSGRHQPREYWCSNAKHYLATLDT